MSLSLLPWHRRALVDNHTNGDPFNVLQREMNRLMQHFQHDADVPAASNGDWLPSVNVTETAKEFQISAELPGVEEKDVSVTIDDGVLTLKGEKRAEKEEKEKNYHRLERSYGMFQRAFSLPHGVDDAKTEASFKNGVLTVRVPKSVQAQQNVKKIPVKSA